MQMLEVEEYYRFCLQGKTEDELQKVVQNLKIEIESLEKKVDLMVKEEKEQLSLKDRLYKWFFRLSDDWYESYELGCVRICLDYDRLYLKRAEVALEEINKKER